MAFQQPCCSQSEMICNRALQQWLVQCNRGRRGCDRMVVGFTTTYAVGAYHH